MVFTWFITSTLLVINHGGADAGGERILGVSVSVGNGSTESDPEQSPRLSRNVA